MILAPNSTNLLELDPIVAFYNGVLCYNEKRFANISIPAYLPLPYYLLKDHRPFKILLVPGTV